VGDPPPRAGASAVARGASAFSGTGCGRSSCATGKDGRDRLESERRAFTEALASGSGLRRGELADSVWHGLLPWARRAKPSASGCPSSTRSSRSGCADRSRGAFASPGPLGPRDAGRDPGGRGRRGLPPPRGGRRRSRRPPMALPGERHARKLEYEARYGAPGGVEVTERYRLERVSHRAGRPSRRGCASGDVRGALTGSPRPTASTSRRRRSTGLLEGADTDVERLVLAVAWRHRLPPRRRTSSAGSPPAGRRA